MKHELLLEIDKADANINHNVNIPTEEIGELIDKVGNVTVTIIVALTLSTIARRWFGGSVTP